MFLVIFFLLSFCYFCLVKQVDEIKLAVRKFLKACYTFHFRQ